MASQIVRLCVLLIGSIFFVEFFTAFFSTSLMREISSLTAVDKDDRRRYFAVFGCSTPDRTGTHRGFDYAFYLPLTVLAWKRIDFESLILIIGERKDWRSHPALSYVLDTLDGLPAATVVFIPSKVENRMMLSQTARIFVANMKSFPGASSDHVMTTDSDLWPLRKEHFHLPPGMMTMERNRLILVHSQCCGTFSHGGRSYAMLPMSHIGASAATWRQMINANTTGMMLAANDSASILHYFRQVFGERVYQRVVFASDDWYLDQKLISIRFDEWISLRNPDDYLYKVSDAGFQRIDRAGWNVDGIDPNHFANYFDAHLPLNGFVPKVWSTIAPLIRLMYGNSSLESEWCNSYATRFHEKTLLNGSSRQLCCTLESTS